MCRMCHHVMVEALVEVGCRILLRDIRDVLDDDVL